MRIIDAIKQDVPQPIERNCSYQFAVYDIEIENCEPTEPKNKGSEYDTITTYFSAVRLRGYILPTDTGFLPAKYSAVWREVSEQVLNVEDELSRKTVFENKRFSCPVTMYNYCIAKAKHADRITIGKDSCIIFTIETTDYDGQIKVK
jgi:hypothetical protein